MRLKSCCLEIYLCAIHLYGSQGFVVGIVIAFCCCYKCFIVFVLLLGVGNGIEHKLICNNDNRYFKISLILWLNILLEFYDLEHFEVCSRYRYCCHCTVATYNAWLLFFKVYEMNECVLNKFSRNYFQIVYANNKIYHLY